MQVEKSGFWRASWNTNEAAAWRQNTMNILKHLLNFLLRTIFSAGNAVKSALINNTIKRILNDFIRFNYVHQNIWKEL
jgi:hypothetical protein